MRSLALASLALLASGMSQPSPLKAEAAGTTAVQSPALSVAHVNGVELHFVELGSGVPIVFVHGGLADYREWAPAVGAMPAGYRTIMYSRRHSFPNRNAPPGTDHSMLQEVQDLAGLIEILELGPVHVAGLSYGAFTVLMLALHRPDLVRSVIAAEPPLLHWLPEIEGGKEANDHFQRAVMAPSAAAFASGDDLGALAVALDHFVGPDALNTIPPEIRDRLVANVDDWRAITTAPEALPRVTRAQMATIRAPVLLISGARTADVHRLIDPELARVVPGAERVIIAEGTHEMCSEKPLECAVAVANFTRGR